MKVRDESVPAPGWTICDEERGKYIRDGGLTDKSGTWLAYDEEHGYAPDEARIRADERARWAKALHRMAVEETESDQRSAGLHEAAMFVERGEGA